MVALSVLFVTLPAHAAPHAGTGTITVRVISTAEDGKWLIDRSPKHEASKGDVIWISSLVRNQVTQFGRPKGALVGSDRVIFRVVTTSKLTRDWTRAFLEERSGQQASSALGPCRRTR